MTHRVQPAARPVDQALDAADSALGPVPGPADQTLEPAATATSRPPLRTSSARRRRRREPSRANLWGVDVRGLADMLLLLAVVLLLLAAVVAAVNLIVFAR